MNFQDIEKLSYENQPIPKQMSLSESQCFICLRGLYNDYKKSNIEPDNAKTEKQIIKQNFIKAKEDEFRQFAMYKQYQYDIKLAGDLRSKMSKMVISGKDDVIGLLDMALKCIGLMCGEMVSYRLIMDKVIEITEAEEFE